MTLQESLDICDQFPDLLVQEVNFTGGEPLLSEHWPEIAVHLKELDIAVKMLTNGVTLSHELINQMRELGFAGVGISLDGLTSTHDYLRGRDGLFHHVLVGMRMIQEVGLPLTVITTVNALNISELPTLLKTLTSEGVRFWQIQPLFPLGRGAANTQLQLSKEEFLRLGDFVSQWDSIARNRGLEIMPSDSFGYFTERDKRVPMWGGCSAGLFSCGITSDGKVKGCLSLPDNIVEGDLRKDNLWDIWYNPDAFAYTRQFSNADLGPNCNSCDWAEQCQGGCSAMSIGCTGRFHNNSFCFQSIEQKK